MGIENIIFILILGCSIFLFIKKVKEIRFNINLGRDLERTDQKKLRWKTMARVALGQSKMTTRPVAGILHIVVYLGFVIINIEVLEIIIDGVFGTHRVLSSLLGDVYPFIIAFFEILAFLVLVSCVIFLIRRNILKIKRFHSTEMKKWPKSDANIILVTEVLLMSAFLLMNAADSVLMENSDFTHSINSSAFPISQYLSGILPQSELGLQIIERGTWWFHIVGILVFLNYLPYSKHLHIILAFPNVFYSNLNPKGKINNIEAVTKEVELMFDPDADPFAAPAEEPTDEIPQSFGAKDVTDLSWKNLMDAYSCTECGRCTSSCPANITGKLLSPRKIMMDTRDRLEEIGSLKLEKGNDFTDDKSLLGDYISEEELRACTTCNACVQECPINIDPLSIIVDLRRYLVMEQSSAPQEWNTTFTNIENNGAPWQFSPSDRLNWATED